MTVYGASPVRRKRRTNAELAEVDDAIVEGARIEHPVTLRGVYYRVVSAGAVDKTDSGYQVVGRRLLALRRCGRVPYSWITDGTRLVQKPDSWSDLDEMLDEVSASYRRALWRDQAAEVMVFVEKDAISGTVYPVTAEWDVPLGVLRGYASETFAYSVAEEIKAARKPVFLYQLGDHDPSGLDAWRDFQRKVADFLGYPTYSTGVATVAASEHERLFVGFERLAVTEEQIEHLNLPTRPTKATDTRARNFTGGSVEVDAIPPTVLRAIVRQAIEQHINAKALVITRSVEEEERRGLEMLRNPLT